MHIAPFAAERSVAKKGFMLRNGSELGNSISTRNPPSIPGHLRGRLCLNPFTFPINPSLDSLDISLEYPTLCLSQAL